MRWDLYEELSPFTHLLTECIDEHDELFGVDQWSFNNLWSSAMFDNS